MDFLLQQSDTQFLEANKKKEQKGFSGFGVLAKRKIFMKFFTSPLLPSIS